MKLTYLILTYNRKEALERHLNLLKEQTYREPFELIVCVDGSTDGTQQMLAERGVRWFDTGNINENRAAQAKNLGIKAATGDIIIMMDDDCLPHPQLIESYLKEFTHQAVQLGYKSNRESYLSMSLPIKVESDNKTMTIWKQEKNGGSFDHFQCGNCCMSISAARTIAKDGSRGFDERFTGYGHEDTEFGRRLFQVGHRFHFNLNAVAWHMNPDQTPQQNPTMKAADKIKTFELLNAIMSEPPAPGGLPYPSFARTTGMMSVEELRWLHETAQGMSSVLEVGSFLGRSTHALLCGCQGLVYSVDPREADFIGTKQQAIDIRRSFLKSMERFDHLRIMEVHSPQAARCFADKSLEMVFIDGDHNYKPFRADLDAWLPKTAKIICGHDYCERQFPGVVQAVKETFGNAFGLCETIWWANV